MEDTGFRDSSSLGLRWEQGVADGGNALSAYLLSYGVYVENVEPVLTTVELNDLAEFTSTVVSGLAFGSYYVFKVQAKNDFGLSDYSYEIVLLCAYIPEAPAEPTSTIVAN